MSAVDIGTGTTISFGTSGFAAQILDVTPPNLAREPIDTSHMGTPPAGAGQVGSRTFMPGDLVDPGELSFDIHFNPDTVPPISDVAETVTITFPLPVGMATPATWAGQGFLTGYEPSVPLEDKMTGSITVKMSGPITIVAAAP